MADADEETKPGGGATLVALAAARAAPAPRYVAVDRHELNLILRVYWPKQAVIDGHWNPPGVKLVTQ